MSAVSTHIEVEDLQNGILHPRPSPYAAQYIIIRVDDRRDGREMLRRLRNSIASAANFSPTSEGWLTIAISFQGLTALGVPQSSLDTFPAEFQEGMAARAELLGDTGENSPENWEKPLGSPDVHVALSVIAPNKEKLEALLAKSRDSYRDLNGVAVIWRQDSYVLPNEREAFGFKDGISHPAIEGSGIPGTNPQEAPFKAGEFVTGYTDETGEVARIPQPEVLGRNGTYVVFRKLYQDVATFRQFIRAKAKSPDQEELLAAKFVGRWRSGAPLSLSPDKDDPELGADPKRNNDFLYRADDEKGLKCPIGSHIRRMNARDAVIVGETRLHRMIRRGTSYGPPLPEGELPDDGADRGLCFVFVGAHLARQFEFVQTQWVNDGRAFAAPAEKDPLIGGNDGTGQFTVPTRPIRQRLTGLPRFVVTRGGEYFFAPSLSALLWISELQN